MMRPLLAVLFVLLLAFPASACTFVEGDAYHIANLVPEPTDHTFLANAFHGVPDKPRLKRDDFSLNRTGIPKSGWF